MSKLIEEKLRKYMHRSQESKVRRILFDGVTQVESPDICG